MPDLFGNPTPEESGLDHLNRVRRRHGLAPVNLEQAAERRRLVTVYEKTLDPKERERAAEGIARLDRPQLADAPRRTLSSLLPPPTRHSRT